MRALRLRIWIAERLRPTPWQSTLFWAAAAGILGALGSWGFRLGAEGVHQLLTGSTEGVVESFRRMPWWGRLLVPAIGGLLAGGTLLLGRRLVPGQSSTDYMEAIVLGTGRVPVRASLVKICSALFSIGSGGSIGREGPMVQLAAVLSSRLGRWGAFSPPQLRLMVACGAAAGITAAYNAPIAGAFFVAEIILGSIAMESLGPLVTASVAAALTMRAVTSVHTLYAVPKFTPGSPWAMGPFLVLGVLAGLLAPWFLRSLRGAESLFMALRLPLALRLALGGLIVGALSIVVPEVCGNGYSVVVDILNAKVAWQTLALIMACKWLATAASVGSGAPGGVFTPSLFMGASGGYLFGTLLLWVWPGSALDPQAFALVGMGAFLSAATHAPVMAVIMLFEMTLSYDIILPLMLCAVVAYYVAKSVAGQSVYSESLRRKTIEEPGGATTITTVAQLVKPHPPMAGLDTSFREVAQAFIAGRFNHIYVLDDHQVFAGAISLHDIKPYLNEPELAEVVLARDLVQYSFPHVRPEQSLDEALHVFLNTDAGRLPAVSPEGKLIGSLAKTDLLLALAERIKRPNRTG